MNNLKRYARSFLIREDEDYQHFNEIGKADSVSSRIFYLMMYLLPGILGYFLINNEFIYLLGLRLTGLQGNLYQYSLLILITFGWHIIMPVFILRTSDKMSWEAILRFLNLNSIDWKGLLLVMPIMLTVVFLFSLPYMRFIGEPLENWLNTFPFLQIPEHSIFCCYEKIYGFPPLMLLFLFIGNFLGEELYYRGYLLKKTSFLGKWNWVVNAILFTIYHFWQIPQTYPYIGLVPIFSLMMIWRKNLYVLIVMHMLWNLLWPLFMSHFYYA